MKKSFIALFFALLSVAVYAAEPVTAAAYIKAHYNDWPGVIAAKEAGTVALTGKYTADAPFHTAQWYAGTLSDAGLYELTEAELASEKPNYPSAYLSLFRLGERRMRRSRQRQWRNSPQIWSPRIIPAGITPTSICRRFTPTRMSKIMPPSWNS